MGVDSLHPLVLSVFFAVAIASSLALSHPAYVCISFACAVVYAGVLGGWRALAGCAGLTVAALVFAALFVFNVHFGVTVVAHTPIGNAVTLESAVFGLIAGFKVVTAIIWASCVVKVFTADKVVFLAGRLSPRAALYIAVILRWCSTAATQVRRYSGALTGIGCGAGQGGVFARMRNWVSRISALVSWSIDRLGQMSASMRSRGSGLRGRSAYALFRFDVRDRVLSLGLAVAFSLFIAGVGLDQARVLFDPQIIVGRMSALSLVFYAAYAFFLLLPFLMSFVSEVSLKKAIRRSEQASSSR